MHTTHILSAVLMAALLTACTDDSETPDPAPAAPQPQTADVPVTLELGSEWSVDAGTRALPPGVDDTSQSSTATDHVDDGQAEMAGVDRIQLIAFRRPAGARYTYSKTDPNDGFVYDAENSALLTVTAALDSTTAGDALYPGSHTHRRARHTLHKTYGFEYQLVAVAYNSQRVLPYVTELGNNTTDSWKADDQFNKGNSEYFSGDRYIGEHNFFRLPFGDGMTLNHLEAFLNVEMLTWWNATNKKNAVWEEYGCGHDHRTHQTGHIGVGNNNDYFPLVCVPQLFYAKCQVAQSDTVHTADTPIIPFANETVTGDSVSHLPVTGTLLRGVAKVEVVIDKVEKHKYAAIEHSMEWITLLADNVVTSVGLSSYDDFTAGYGASPQSNFANARFTLISVKKSPGNGKSVTLTAYLLPCRTRLALRARYDINVGANGGLRNASIWVHNKGAGDTPTGVVSPEAVGNIYYLRRNHKYVFKITSTEYMFQDSHDFN